MADPQSASDSQKQVEDTNAVRQLAKPAPPEDLTDEQLDGIAGGVSIMWED